MRILNKCVLKLCVDFLARNELVNKAVDHLVTPNEVMCNWLFCSAISGFRREVDENCARLGYYAAYIGDALPTFRGNVSASSSRVKNRDR
jgi:hypothetical protein